MTKKEWSKPSFRKKYYKRNYKKERARQAEYQEAVRTGRHVGVYATPRMHSYKHNGLICYS